MEIQIFPQTTIAVIWDFDETLIPGSMQSPIFEEYGIDEKCFWDEVNNLSSYYATRQTKVNPSSAYLNHILTYVKCGKLEGLSNGKLQQLGAKIEFFDGVTELFQRLKENILTNIEFQKHEINVELYVVSSGLTRMIKGSKISPFVDDVWGCEFIEEVAPPGYLTGDQAHLMSPQETEVSQIGFVIDDTTKTRAVFEINKGVNRHSNIYVNSQIPQGHRRVPFKNMIYVADGPSDIPVFSLLHQYGGRTYAVYKPESEEHFEKVYNLQRQDRIEAHGPADYREGTPASMWIERTVRDIAKRIVEEKELALQSALQQPPSHVSTSAHSGENGD